MTSRELATQILRANPNQFEKKIPPLLDRLAAQQLGFNWEHGGTLNLKISELKQFFEKQDICAARTGHLGNWDHMAKGCAGTLDHNANAVKSGLAYPYVYDLNQTENNQMNSGDTVYLSGSVVENGQRKILDLYTWDGSLFAKRDRSESYFVPFVMAQLSDGLVPLSQIHKNRNTAFKNTKYHSDILLSYEPKLRALLKALIRHIRRENSSTLRLEDLVDRVISKDGIMTRCHATLSTTGVQVGPCRYDTCDELIDAILLPIKAAQAPNAFFDQVDDWPDFVPFMSLSLISALDYLFAETDDEFLFYAEWGAFGSAGYPPKSRGYFKEKSRSVKKIFELAQKVNKSQKSAFCLLLPSSIFTLLPCSAYPADESLIQDLFTQVLSKTAEISPKDVAKFSQTVDEVSANWWLKNRLELSDYFCGRFENKRCVFVENAKHEKAEPIFLPEFDQLTLQQACLLVGGLFQIAKKSQEVSYAAAS